MCLSVLSIEDVEDIYTTGFLITGFLLIDVIGCLMYCNVQKQLAAWQGQCKNVPGCTIKLQTCSGMVVGLSLFCVFFVYSWTDCTKILISSHARQ